MKGDFIPKFIKTVLNFGSELHDIWNWTPVYYKGIKIKGYNQIRASAGLRNLAYRKIVKLDKNGFKFTEKGKLWFRGSLLKYYRSIGLKWDKKWRVVIFDVPQELHRERNRLRMKLKTLGFYMLQKSVFVFPFPCEEELAKYATRLKLSKHIDIIVAESIGYSEIEIKKFFCL